MCKKFSVMILLAAIIFFCGSDKVFANDYYVGNYKTGQEVYLMTETLNFESMRKFECRVKAVNPSTGKLVTYIDYYFDGAADEPETWKNSQGYGGTINEGNVSGNIYKRAMEIWNEKILKTN